jgi:hypothetical protein
VNAVEEGGQLLLACELLTRNLAVFGIYIIKELLWHKINVASSQCTMYLRVESPLPANNTSF